MMPLLRKEFPNTRLLGWYEDTIESLSKQLLDNISYLDHFAATGSGDLLKKTAGVCNVHAAFMPNPCDPDLEKPYHVSDRYQSDILFTGKFKHKKCGLDGSRAEIIKKIAERYRIDLYGPRGRPSIYGLEYYRRISGAKIALSINATNNICKYHSDRLINYLACGAFVLAKYVPDSDTLFQEGKHLRYFSDLDECKRLINYYLSHPAEREKIARQGMQHAHRMFNCRRIARDLIDFVQTGRYDEPWAEIFS